jgi:RNA polymerase sigma-70 factor (ECF subfamily)
MLTRREQLENELLVLRCRQGDSEAFSQLVNHWQDRLWQYAYRLTLSNAAACDLAQETWCAVVAGLHKLKDVDVFPSWLFGIHHRKCVDWIRKEQRRNRKTRALAERGNPTGTASHSQNRDLLETAIRKLPPDRKALIGLRYKEGFSTEQIAGILNIPEGTVKSRLQRTIDKLRTLVEQESHE